MGCAHERGREKESERGRKREVKDDLMVTAKPQVHPEEKESNTTQGHHEDST